MKTLEELGISPGPWHLFGEHMVCYKNGMCVCDDEGNFHTSPDARLIAAAPELYECLRDIVCDYCRGCVNKHDGKCTKEPGGCFAQRYRSALEKAGGAEEIC